MPEKSKMEIPRALREQYEKGMLNLERGNLDYALSLFGQVLHKEPAFYDCREALRATQFRKTGGKTGFFKKVLGTASNSPLLAKGQYALRNHPRDAIHLAEQILNGDASNAQAHKLLAEAALNADLPRTAVLSLEILLKNDPKNRDIAMKLVESLGRIGQMDRADRILSEFNRAFPGDPEIVQALKDLAARRTLSEGGYEALADGQGSYRDILKDKDEAVALEQEKRDVKTEDVTARMIHDYESRLAVEPANLKLTRLLAELYTQRKEFDRALEYYQRIAEREGDGDSSLEQAISDTTVRRFDHALAQLDPQAPDHAETEQRLRAERQTFLVEDCKRRVDRYPSDLQLRFDLGQLYLEAGRLTEAIGEFQKAQNNPHKRIATLFCLGQCFARKNMADLAARTFQTALKEKLVFDDEKKDLIYALGSVLESVGKREEAIEQFKQIYEIDIGYRDVAVKVDAYYASQG